MARGEAVRVEIARQPQRHHHRGRRRCPAAGPARADRDGRSDCATAAARRSAAAFAAAGRAPRSAAGRTRRTARRGRSGTGRSAWCGRRRRIRKQAWPSQVTLSAPSAAARPASAASSGQHVPVRHGRRRRGARADGGRRTTPVRRRAAAPGAARRIAEGAVGQVMPGAACRAAGAAAVCGRRPSGRAANAAGAGRSRLGASLRHEAAHEMARRAAAPGRCVRRHACLCLERVMRLG